MKQRQYLLKLSLLLFMPVLVFIRPASTFAATTGVTGGTNGPLCNSGGYFTPSTVTVTSGDTITFSVPANDPYAGGVQINGFPQGSFVVPRGGSVTTHALTANVSYQGTWPNSPSCIKGSGTITVQAAASPSAPPNTPPPTNVPSSSPNTASTNSSASSAANSAKSSPTPASSVPPASTAQPMAAPETVVANTISVSGKKVTSIQNLTIDPSQPLVLSGTTVPNGKITLTIHSHPTTATVQADASGNWNYTVSGLQPGSHTVYATVTDPATKQTSTSSKLLAFTISAAPVASVTHAASPPAKKNTLPAVLVIISVIVVLLFAAVGVLILKKRNGTKSEPPMNPSVVPSVSEVPPSVQTSLVEPQPAPTIMPTSVPPQEGQTPATSDETLVQEPKDNNV